MHALHWQRQTHHYPPVIRYGEPTPPTEDQLDDATWQSLRIHLLKCKLSLYDEETTDAAGLRHKISAVEETRAHLEEIIVRHSAWEMRHFSQEIESKELPAAHREPSPPEVAPPEPDLSLYAELQEKVCLLVASRNKCDDPRILVKYKTRIGVARESLDAIDAAKKLFDDFQSRVHKPPVDTSVDLEEAS